MKAPINYFGGKNIMFKYIIEKFPNRETYDTYIEPFGGSYAVGLNMPYIPPIEIYNDLEKNIYSLYKVLQDENMFKTFQRMCELSPYDDNLRKEYIDTLKTNTDISILNRAYMFFYVNRTSFNGNGGFKINTYIRRGTSKSVSDYLSGVEHLEELHERLKNIIISNTNAIDLIERFNKENVFMYLDPPYVQSTRTSNIRYEVDMNDEEQDVFLETCINSKAKLLISGYDNEKYNILLDIGVYETTIARLNEELAKKPKEVEVVKYVDRIVNNNYNGTVVNCDTYVLFARNSAELDTTAKTTLDKISGTVKIVAYASPEGSDTYNKKLSQRRANAVADYLRGKGVTVTEAYGAGVNGNTSNRVAIVIVQ